MPKVVATVSDLPPAVTMTVAVYLTPQGTHESELHLYAERTEWGLQIRC